MAPHAPNSPSPRKSSPSLSLPVPSLLQGLLTSGYLFDDPNSNATLARQPNDTTQASFYPYPYLINNPQDLENLDEKLNDFMFCTSGIGKCSEINPLTGKRHNPPPWALCNAYPNVMSWLKDVLGPDVADFLDAGFSFDGIWKIPMDLCNYIEWTRDESNAVSGSGGDNFYIQYSSLFSVLRAEAGKAGVRFFDGSQVTHLFQLTSKQQQAAGGAKTPYIATMDNGRGWVAERLVVNSAIENLQYIKGNLGCRLFNAPEVRTIASIASIKCNDDRSISPPSLPPLSTDSTRVQSSTHGI